MEKTEEQKQQILKDLWYKRNPCHDKDQNGVDRFWGTVLCVLEDYNKALTLPIVVVSLPSIESQEFIDWMTDNNFKPNTEGTSVKGNKLYFIDTIYKHYCNVIEFGNYLQLMISAPKLF